MISLAEPITPDPPDWRRRTVMRQSWTELASFHWRYPVDVVQPLLPDGVTVDAFDGSAWVGLIPFEMRRIRFGRTPAVPYLGDFVEINVRTYVIDRHGRRAIWFWSLDIPRAIPVAVARLAFGLPYCWSPGTHERRDDGAWHRYSLTRRWPRPSAGATTGAPTDPSTDIAFRVGERIPDGEVTDFEHFVTARWALLTVRRSRVWYGAVEHQRWPLHRVTDVEIDDSLVAAAGLPKPDGAPEGLYSPGVDVRLAWLDQIPRTEHA